MNWVKDHFHPAQTNQTLRNLSGFFIPSTFTNQAYTSLELNFDLTRRTIDAMFLLAFIK